MPTFVRAVDSRFADRCRGSWYEAAQIRGRLWLVNLAGGRTPADGMEILETVEAEEFHALDWSKTTLVAPESEAGWLSPFGAWHPCHEQDHIAYADLVLGKRTQELEEAGWVKVCGPPDRPRYGITWVLAADRRRLTAEQRNWLSRRGHEIGDYD